MEKDKNTSRANQTRSKSERPKVWVPPSSLDAPPAPDGFRYRWIRAEVVGYQDTKNITSRLREGYELVRAEEVENASDYPVLDEGKYKGVIGVGGLLLLSFFKCSGSDPGYFLCSDSGTDPGLLSCFGSGTDPGLSSFFASGTDPRHSSGLSLGSDPRRL